MIKTILLLLLVVSVIVLLTGPGPVDAVEARPLKHIDQVKDKYNPDVFIIRNSDGLVMPIRSKK